jgi:hypothetical protein
MPRRTFVNAGARGNLVFSFFPRLNRTTKSSQEPVDDVVIEVRTRRQQRASMRCGIGSRNSNKTVQLNVATERGVDFLEWVLRAGVVAAIVLVVASVIIAYHNLGSKTIVLGVAALVGFLVAFGLQLWLELRPSSKEDQVSFAYTADFQNRQIGRWGYTKVDTKSDALDLTAVLVEPRIPTEIEAGGWIFKEHANVITNSMDKVASDLAIFSLAAFLGHAERDWHWKYRRFNNPTIAYAMIGGASHPDECSMVTEQDLRRQLVTAGNLFADSRPPFVQGSVCLPRGTSLHIGSSEVSLRNPVFQIVFALEDTGERGGNHGVPRKPMEQPKLPDGAFRFDTRGVSFDVRTTFPRLHAYDAAKPEYEAWLDRLLEHLKAWFACC